MDNVWLVNGTLLTPHGVVQGAVKIRGERIVALQRSAPSSANRIDVRGAYVAPGFIDVHVWGEPATIARESPKGGTTAFLTTLGPALSKTLVNRIAERVQCRASTGAACLGIHLEGPFVNPACGGALPRRGMRAPTIPELKRLLLAAQGRLRLVTMAPELPGALEAIRWCRTHGVAVSLGHSEAASSMALRAVEAGAKAVTHVFNGMRPLSHRAPTLIDVALTDPRVTTMVIADGIHVSPRAFQLLVHAKGVERIALVTDSIRYQGWKAIARGGAFYTTTGVLAGSNLTMMRAVRNAVEFASLPVLEAVRMASEVPARLLGLERSRGSLTVGKRADLVVFDRRFRVLLTMVGGRIVWRSAGAIRWPREWLNPVIGPPLTRCFVP